MYMEGGSEGYQPEEINYDGKYLDNFSWGEIDDADEEKQILLNDFKKDLEDINGNKGDLEENLLPKVKRNQIRPALQLNNSDKETAPNQPADHAKNKAFAETLFSNCCCRSMNNDLNRRELRCYARFKQTMFQ